MSGEGGRAHSTPSVLDSPFGKARGMVFPRVVLVGHGVLADLGSTCRQFDFPDRGVVITGPKTAELAGYRATEILKESKFDASTIIANIATEEEVDRVEREARAAGARFLVGAGGGSKIDITKVVANRLRVPFVSLPTSAGHDGISSPRASIHGSATATSTQAAVPGRGHRGHRTHREGARSGCSPLGVRTSSPM